MTIIPIYFSEENENLGTHNHTQNENFGAGDHVREDHHHEDDLILPRSSIPINHGDMVEVTMRGAAVVPNFSIRINVFQAASIH